MYAWYARQDRRRLVLLIIDGLIEERLKERTFQRLLFNQALADHDQTRFILLQNMVRLIESLLNDAAHLFINLTRRLLTVVALFTKVASQEDQLLLMA